MQTLGIPPTFTIGFGITSVYSDNLVPNPPASINTFITRSNLDILSTFIWCFF